MSDLLASLAYLIAAALFILGLKNLSHPRTAVRGNILGSLGMLVAVVVTLLNQQIISFEVILAGLIVGGLIGTLFAARIQMTAMPQLVAVFNGLGGGASALVAGATLLALVELGMMPLLQNSVATGASGLIGALTFFGSFIAFGKLQGLFSDKPVLIPGRHAINAILFLSCVGAGVLLVLNPLDPMLFLLVVVLASLLGITLVLPIGGADMPVVISLLNSYSGLAASATGFVLNNSVLIIAGSLVGAAGLILTHLMCVAMNRSLPNVLFGGIGAVVAKNESTEDIYEGNVKSTSAEEVVMLMDGARRVVIVPGYGMAVAQAQHAVRDLMNLLEARDIEVEFAIHPVAGRMPGHMNVLLAEADVPYDKLIEMDMINPTFEQTDLVLVIGANDVVNPSARDDQNPSNPIAGMPILEVDRARTVVVIKRSLSPGFAGIPNPLFSADNNLMLFGDGKQVVLDMTSALKGS
jgi:NAD(P) transhydrogenase subunit beta